jgi:hypothetical protein
MTKQQLKPAPDDDTPCDDQGPVSFSLETLIGHRKLEISSWKHLRNTRLLVILSSFRATQLRGNKHVIECLGELHPKQFSLLLAC